MAEPLPIDLQRQHREDWIALTKLVKDKYRELQQDRRGIGHATANALLNLEFQQLAVLQIREPEGATPGVGPVIDQMDQMLSRIRKVEIRVGKIIKGQTVSQLDNVSDDDLKE